MSIYFDENDYITYYPFFSNNENISTAGLFEAKKFYYENSIPFIENKSVFQVPFGDLYKQNALYGILDHEGDIVIPVEVNRYFTNLGSNRNLEHKIQNFAADAFIDMKQFIQFAKIKGKLFAGSVYDDMQVYTSYENIDVLYRNHHYILANDFKNYTFNNKEVSNKIVDYPSFIKEFVNYMKYRFINLPFTKSQTTIYFNFFTFSSGLIFDFARGKADDDTRKFKTYFSDVSFHIFSEACLRFGFAIDKNVPWRLYADLNSPAMKPYLEKYDIKSVEDLFKKRYKKVYIDDLIELKAAMYRAYLFFILDNEEYDNSHINICSNNIVKYKRKKISWQESLKLLDNNYWLRLYTYIRNYETDKGMTPNQFNNLVRDASEFIKYNKVLDAMKFVNNFFKDYKQVSYFYSLQPTMDMLELPVSNYSAPDIIL